MNLFEYQAKEAFRECGIATPKGVLVRSVEELGAASGLPTGLLLGTLMKLELAGRVTCLPGKRYILR